MRYLLIFIFTLLVGCTTMGLPGSDSWSYNPQNYQGCTVGKYVNGDMAVTWWDCKDKAEVSGSVDLNGDGVPDFTYSASDVVGSDAAAIRASVEKAFIEAGVAIIPDVVNGIVKSLSP